MSGRRTWSSTSFLLLCAYVAWVCGLIEGIGQHYDRSTSAVGVACFLLLLRIDRKQGER